ncbi:MAG: toprim domain-containing protein, partial [Enterobacteriaceae bacterium]
ALARQAEPEKILLVEGYMDVVALAQFGVDYAVATLGTATTAEHIQLLFRTTDMVICCYDGDRAGRDAAWRALETALPHLSDGRQLRFMFLPEGEDPDSLIRKQGKEQFEQAITTALPLSAFLFDTLLPQVDLSSPEGRTKLSTLALPLINQVPGETLRLYLRQQFGLKLGILDEAQLEKLLPKENKGTNSYQPVQLKYTAMRILISLLVQNPRLATLIPSLEGLEQSKQPGLPLFMEITRSCLAHPGLTTGQLLELYRDNKYAQQLETLAVWNHMIVDEMIEPTFMDTLEKLYDSVVQQRLDELIARERVQGLTTEERHEYWSLNLALMDKSKN